MRVGFIGLGNLGYRLANNLVVSNVETFIYDLKRDLGKELEEKGAVWMDSPQRVAESSDICITCLPSPEAVSIVLEGSDGLLKGLGPEKLWIEMSTTDSEEVIRLGRLAEGRGAKVVEAPVSGGCHRASTGNISILVGGNRDAFEVALPILKIIGHKIIHVGEIGKASVLKVVTNFLASTHLVAIGEALMVCKRSGLDLGKAFKGIQASSGNSFVHETESQVILSGSYNVNFTMDLVCKDVGLFHNLVEKLGIKADLSPLITEIFREGRDTFGDKSWSTKIVKRLEDACKENLRAEGFPSELIDEESKAVGVEL
jgi:3-hydroxyisobutyrate dehydrogenase